MKKIIPLFISLVMIFSMTACSGKDNSDEELSNKPSTEKIMNVSGHKFTLEKSTENGKEVDILDSSEIEFYRNGICSIKDIEDGKAFNETAGTYTQVGNIINITWQITNDWDEEAVMTLNGEELTQSEDETSYDQEGHANTVVTVKTYKLAK